MNDSIKDIISLLPQYNTSSVFVFDKFGEIIFRNDIADETFENINNISDFGEFNYRKFIRNSSNFTYIYKNNEKTYQLDMKGSQKENLLFMYVIDISEVTRLSDELEVNQREIIFTLGQVGETRSKETGYHVKRVALYSEILAKLYGLSNRDAKYIKMASPLHDIGKIGIPDNILNKPGKLTESEFEVMKTHAELGYKMLKKSNSRLLKLSAIISYEHHEKYDGTGYPRQIKEEEISIYARITAIADVFDALGSERVYKKAWELEDIISLLKKEKGKQFDPELIDLFLNNLDDFLVIRDEYQDL